MEWKVCTMREALIHSKYRLICADEDEKILVLNIPFIDGSVTIFTDGTAISCESKYRVAADYAEDPQFWIYS